MTNEKPSIEALLGDLKLGDPSAPMDPLSRKAITLWFSSEDKARYDRLQTMSWGDDRKFSAVIRNAILKLIELAETRMT